MTAASTAVQTKVTLRHTFIDLDVEDQECGASPRAHSDPGLSRRRDLLCDDQEDQDQQKYVEHLDDLYQCDSLVSGENRVVGAASECGASVGLRPWIVAGRPRAILPAAALAALPSLEEAFGESPRHESSPDPREVAGSAAANAQDLPLPAALLGDWVNIDDGESTEGVWSIGVCGRVLFNGKRFGKGYDMSLRQGPFGGRLVCRADGWILEEAASTRTTLVWLRGAGATAERIMWTRAVEVGSSPDAQGREDVAELRCRMRESIEVMSKGWSGEGRLRSANAVIEDAQRRICEDMDRAQSYIVDNVQSRIRSMKQQLKTSCADSPSCSATRRDVDKVVNNLQVIPTMIQNVLDVRLTRAREQVRQLVGGMVKDVGALLEEDQEVNLERLAAVLQRIVKEAVQMAAGAVSSAAHECQKHATKQLEVALSALGEKGFIDLPQDLLHHGLWWQASAWEVGHDPWRVSRTIAQALEVVQNKDHIPHSMGNQVVADQLLRARIRGGGGGDMRVPSEDGLLQPSVDNPRQADVRRQDISNVQGAGDMRVPSAGGPLQLLLDNPRQADVRRQGISSVEGARDMRVPSVGGPLQLPFDNPRQADVRRPGISNVQGGASRLPHHLQSSGNGVARGSVNPGSRGHPDVCRPCVFHSQGNCTKGETCGFCHIVHPKRPVRFDKLHRDALNKMSFARLVQVILPVLCQKYSNVQEHMAVETKSMLSTLWTHLEDHASIERTRSADGGYNVLETLLDEVESEAQTSRAHRSDCGFVGVLAAMALRPLLATLAAKVPQEMVALRAHIEASISIIHGKRGTTVAANFPAAAPVTQLICTAGIPVVAFPLTGAAGATPGLAAPGPVQPRVDGDVGRRPRGFEPLNQRPECAAY